TNPTTFPINQSLLISAFDFYFWNGGRGLAGSPRYTLSNSTDSFGPYFAVGSPGQGGALVNWRSNPHIVIPAGLYTVEVDRGVRGLWSQNTRSNGEGFARIEGEPQTIGSIGTIFDNSNVDQVFNNYFGPPRRTTFQLVRPTLITKVRTYHYNGGLDAGAFPVDITIRDATMRMGLVGAVGVPR